MYLCTKIVRYYQNICKLTRLFFIALIKPFLWKFPLIYFLEKNSYEYLNAPVPIIIGVDSKMADYKFRININNISNNLITYFIKEDIIEKDDIKLLQPTFNNKIDSLQKRYIRLQKYLANPSQIAFKSKNTIFQSYLNRCRQILYDTIINPLIKDNTYKQSKDSITAKIIEENKKDAKFFEQFCKTMMFTTFIQMLNESENPENIAKTAICT